MGTWTLLIVFGSGIISVNLHQVKIDGFLSLKACTTASTNLMPSSSDRAKAHCISLATGEIVTR